MESEPERRDGADQLVVVRDFDGNVLTRGILHRPGGDDPAEIVWEPTPDATPGT